MSAWNQKWKALKGLAKSRWLSRKYAGRQKIQIGMMDKKELRRIVAKRKKEYPDGELTQMSRAVTERLRGLEAYRAAETVFAYMDLPGEVKMREFIRLAWAEGKTVAVPKICPVKAYETDCEQPVREGTSMEMRFFRIDSFDDLREGMMHIMEPDPDKCECLDHEEKALIIMPGVAFDEDLHRAGYGGGFYDRYLAAHPHHPTVAAAYEFQIFERVPAEPQDILPQLLVTEDRIIGPGSEERPPAGGTEAVYR